MLTSSRPGRCKHCKVRFEPEDARKRLHPECVDPWMAAFKEKQARKAIKERVAQKRIEKAETKARKEAIKTIPELRAEAQIEFNKFVRARDADLPCVSCGKAPGDLSGLHAGRDAGHYRSTGSASHLRFDERNCHGQCVHCNQHLAGNVVSYRIGLVARIGLAAVEALEADNSVQKWDRDTLRQIKTIYRAKTRQLIKERA